MKKVLFVATVDSHIELFHLPFLAWFKRHGYEVHVATDTDKPVKHCDKKIKLPIKRNPFSLNNLKAIRELKRVLIQEKYDIIQANTPMGGVVARLAAKQAKKHLEKKPRVIYMAHGLHFYKGAPLKNWLLFYPVEKHLARYTDTMILINREDLTLAKRKFKRCSDIQYIPGVGVDEKKFAKKLAPAKKHELRESLGLKDDDFVMIYPAELSKRKAQIWLIKTVAQTLKNNPKIQILLPGKDSLRGKCQKAIKKYNLESQIHCLGFRNDVPELLKISDLAISTSSQEGLPVNIMEALATGLPVVAKSARGVNDLLERQKNSIIVQRKSPEQFISGIKSIKVGAMSNSKLDKKYQIANILQNMQKIYTKKPVVLHVLASKEYSGAEKVARDIIDATKGAYDAYYCSPDGPIADRLEGVSYVPIKKLTIHELSAVVKQYSPDIIHAHDFRASLTASFFHKNRTIISHIHQNPLWLGKTNFKTLTYKYRSKYFAKILVVSKSVLDEYKFSETISKKAAVLRNCVNKDMVIKQSREFEKQSYTLCFVGRFVKAKNPIGFLEIFREFQKSHPDATACMIGDGELRGECEKFIADNKLDKHVKLLGAIDNPYKVIKKCQFVVIPSIYDGFSLVAVEATILGVPAINSGVGGLKYIFANTDLVAHSKEEYLAKLSTHRHILPKVDEYTSVQNWKKQLLSTYRGVNNA